VSVLLARELRPRWEAAAKLVAEHRDVLDARAGAGETPPPLALRGWSSFLASIDDATLDTLERRGDTAWPADTPPALLALVAASREVCTLPSFATAGDEVRALRRRETPRKRAQIEAFARLVLPLAANATRVVDVGSGHGHLTREIAERIERPVVGFERDAALADRARSLPSSAPPDFAVTDVLADGLTLSAGDCVIGLHACGELGDAIVESAARSGAAVALVGCCLQKRRAEARSMLCAAPAYGAALELPRNLLGLSNLSPGDDGVEATRVENLEGRVNRLVLHRLLSKDGTLRLGAEIDGLNRRASHGDLDTFVARAFAVRSPPAPSKSAIEEAAAWARDQHGRARRMTLPRATLARALEVLVLLDRALYLEEHGFDVSVGTLFPAAVSARNLALAAKR
jgi:protein-L-isoaspartate O-methyltransferase